MKWIRWEVDAPDHPVVYALAEALAVKPAQALGHYNAFCSRVGQHAEDGVIATVPDAAIETWAMWDGKRGKFAEAIRAACQDEDGRVKGWWRQDKLRKNAEAARERARKIRERCGNDSETVLEHSISRARAPAPSRLVVVDDKTQPLLEGVRGNLPDRSHEALEAILGWGGDARALLSEIKAVADGMRGASYPWPVIGRALEELWAAGPDWSPRRFQAFCRKIAEPTGGKAGGFADELRAMREREEGTSVDAA